MADYKSKTDEGKCIFCEIAKKNIKIAGTFWENEKYVAFLSGWPNTEGFTVIMPKKHYHSDVFAMPDDVLGEFVSVAKKIANVLTKHFKDVGRVGMITEGTGVDHAHIKLFPMHGTEGMKTGKWKQIHSKCDKYFETYEGYMSSNDGPKADEAKISKLANELKKLL